MQINILSTSVEDKGKYKMLEVAYKAADGKVSAKKLMSFTFPDVFKVISSAKTGDVLSVTTVKNDKGFWDWTAVEQGSGTETATKATGASNTTPRSTYETAEERANRQVLIVRQSSLSNAVDYYGLNPKKAPTPQEVTQLAQFFEDYVFGRKDSPPSVQEEPEFDEDIPL